MPMVQSKGSEAGVKAVRRVTEVEREGSSEREMGEKRVSSKALDVSEFSLSGEGLGMGRLGTDLRGESIAFEAVG